jgi:signal transduction histidine kinase
MIRDISRTDEEQCSADVEVIVKEADRLSAMVNEILEYSEMQTEGLDPRFEPVDLSSVVGRVCGNFDSLYSLENGHIEKDIEEHLIISADEGRIERAVYNLLDNAVRHNGESRVINVSLKKEGSEAVLRITDHGEGIPAAELENIWDRYYTYRQRNKKGVSGLGLAIVKQITTLHGGKCSAESTEGKGSTFTLSFGIIK